MKLSEALILRADIQKRVEQLRARLQASVMVQEGEQPPEDPQVLFTELDALLTQFGTLIAQINRTNLNAQVEGGQTVTDALARRDSLHCVSVCFVARQIQRQRPSPAMVVPKSAACRRLTSPHCASRLIHWRATSANSIRQYKRPTGRPI